MKDPSGIAAAPGESTEHSGFGVRERIRSALRSFTPAERRVADAVLRDPMAVIHLSVTELAALAETSPATVVRLCASVGLRGYQDLKIRLASESVPDAQRPLGAITPDDTTGDVVHKVMDATAHTVWQASRTIDPDVLDRVVDALVGARRVVFGAVGTSAPLALDTAYRLVTLGVDAGFALDVHTQHVTARMMSPSDVFFAISHTGSSFETLATARAAKAARAATVALTSFSGSPLTEISDLSVVAGSVETASRGEAMASRMVHLSVLDALVVSVARHSAGSDSQFALTEEALLEHRI